MLLDFRIGSLYSRKDIGDICYPGIGRPPGGNWDTGYVSVEDNLIIFMNIGVPGRTGHDFNNSFDQSSKTIIWYGKANTHSKQPTFEKLLNGELIPHFFARWDQKSKFKYLGIGYLLEYEDHAQTNQGTAIKIKLEVTDKSGKELDQEIFEDNKIEQKKQDYGITTKSLFILNRDVSGLELSVRALNCLSYAKIRKVSDLIVFNEFELMLIPSFGRGTLREIKDILDSYDLSLGANRNRVKKQLLQIESQLEDTKESIAKAKSIDYVSTEIRINNTACLDQISSNDKRFSFRFNEFFRTIDQQEGQINLKDNLLEVLSYTNNTESINSFLDKFDEEIELYLSLNIFDQLSYVLDFLPKTYDQERKEAYIGRFGFNGQKRLTLEETSNVFKKKVTRERVRQIESALLRQLRSLSTKYYLPKLDLLIQHIKDMSPISLDEITKINLSENQEEFMTYDGLKTICEIYNYPFPFKMLKRKGASYIALNNSESVLIEEILKILTRACRSFGMVHFDDAFEYLEQKTEIVIEHDKLQSLIEDSYFASLGESWFCNPTSSKSKNRFENTLQKMLFCYPIIDIGEIREGFKRVVRRRPVGIAGEWDFLLPPKRIMIGYIEHNDSYEINSNNEVRSKKPINFNEIDSYGNENLLIMLSIIEDEESGLLERETLRKKAQLRGVNPNSLQVELTYAPWLKQFGHSIWGIRGSNPKAFDIEMLGYQRRLNRSQRRPNSYEHDEKGQLIIIGQIHNPDAYILTIPSSDHKSIGTEDYILRDIHGKDYGIGRISSGLSFVGLPKVFSRMHIEDNSLIKFRFNYEKKELLIVPIVDEFS